MPQLDTNPWLNILLLSWVALLIIVPSVVVICTFPNDPTLQDMWHPTSEPWNWPWF